jgi:hypothetical protein
MVTIITERGTIDENGNVIRKFDFMKMLGISLATGLLLSLIGAYNLNKDVTNLTQNTTPELQRQIAANSPELMKAAKLHSNNMM